MVKLGKRNQLYAQYVRIMQSAEDPNEIYLVLRKDAPMDRKYIRQFDNMFAGKDIIVSLTLLKRGLSKQKANEEEEQEENPFWQVET